jgi:hypothetical protein
MKRLVLLGIAVSVTLVMATAAGAYVSFSAYISSASYTSYNNTISVSAYASFRDYDCTPSYQCDRNVIGEFTLRQGYSSYGRIVARVDAETGQYGSYMRVRFRIPSCRFIPRYKTRYYTVTMEAAAPNGDEKTSRRTVYVRSCRR